MSDYLKYRGRCKDLAEDAVWRDPNLTLVRGYYLCPDWGKQAHWWTVRKDGTIFDPSAAQFPSCGMGEYVPFDGTIECANCQKEITEETAHTVEGKYAFCSYTCYGQFVGVIP